MIHQCPSKDSELPRSGLRLLCSPPCPWHLAHTRAPVVLSLYFCALARAARAHSLAGQGLHGVPRWTSGDRHTLESSFCKDAPAQFFKKENFDGNIYYLCTFWFPSFIHLSLATFKEMGVWIQFRAFLRNL